MNEHLITEETRAAFLRFVDTSGGDTSCWTWQGGKHRRGYGHAHAMGRQWQAHRLAWTLFRGPIPAGSCVCHACDNPPCVNPSHLFLGSHGDNMQDAVVKGRMASGDHHGLRLHPERLARGDRNGTRQHPEQVARGNSHWAHLHPELRPRGERHGQAKLRVDQVAAIRAAYQTGRVLQRELAAQYGVTKATISLIVRGKNWREVELAQLRKVVANG